MAAMNQSSNQTLRLVDRFLKIMKPSIMTTSVITGTFHDPHAGITIQVMNVTDDSIQFSVDFEDEADMVAPRGAKLR